MSCLFGLAGWRQTVNPEYPQLSPALTSTVSGLYYQDAHPLVSVENLDQALKNYDEFVYPAYAEHAAYAIGDRVRYAGDSKVYEALVVIADAPAAPALPSDWIEVNLFSQKIEALTRAAANKIASAMFTQKKLDGVTKTIFENTQLFGGVGDLMNKEVKQGRFVGLELRLKNAKDLAVLIQRIGTQFSLANPNFKLYIWSSSQSDPVQVIDLALTRGNAFQWSAQAPAVALRYLSEQLIPGGVYYIGYYEDDLQGQAINKGYNFGALPCGSCNNDLALFNTWTRVVDVTPFYVSAAQLVDRLPGDPGGPLLWDYGVQQYVYNNNFGLNLDLSAVCDVTDFLCRSSRVFTDSLVLQVAADVLTELAFSTRNNTIAKEVRDLAADALKDTENKIGVYTKLDNSIKALSFDFSNLSENCLPCNNKNGLSWGSW
jgi:hypothetical protein